VARWTTETRRDPGVYSELSGWWDAQPVAREVPYLNSRILSCWNEGFDEPGSKRNVLLLKHDGDVVAGLPLYKSRGRLRTPSRAHSDSIDVVAGDDPDVWAQIPRWLDGLSIAHLYRLRQDSPLIEAASDHARWSVPLVLQSPYVDLGNGMEHVRAGLSKEFARTLRRRRRRLEELGEVRYVDHPSAADVQSVLNQGFQLEAQGWKGKEGVAVLNLPTHEAWYRSVAEVAEDQRWLRLSALYLNERLIAFRYDLEYQGRRHGLISTYDEGPDVALSTGSLLLESALEQSVADGVDSYEFGYGAHPWKYDWTSKERLVYDLLILGSGLPGQVVAAARRFHGGLRRRAR